ncbi:tyrosine integrase [Mycobacterium phage Hoonter]|nr:tyrosine integrase [Mycobacterium phage Hoonter]
MTDDLLAELKDSWLMELRAARKSAETIRAYGGSVEGYLNFCVEGELAPLEKASLLAWVSSMASLQPATVHLRLTAVKQFMRWVADEEGVNVDGLLVVRPPKLDQKVVKHLSDRAVQALVATCAGNTFRDRRDKALIVLFTETGIRAAEMLALDVEDVSLVDCQLTVRRGKGAKGRRVKYSPMCAATIDKYLRARRRAGHGSEGPLWIGLGGRLSYTGMKSSLKRRADDAGVPGFHPHRLRHTSAVRWLKAGGSEAGLMAQAGWQSRRQIDRYIKSAAEELASDEFDRLNLSVE